MSSYPIIIIWILFISHYVQAKPIYGGWLCLAPEGTDFDNPMQRSRVRHNGSEKKYMDNSQFCLVVYSSRSMQLQCFWFLSLFLSDRNGSDASSSCTNMAAWALPWTSWWGSTRRTMSHNKNTRKIAAYSKALPCIQYTSAFTACRDQAGIFKPDVVSRTAADDLGLVFSLMHTSPLSLWSPQISFSHLFHSTLNTTNDFLCNCHSCAFW